MKQIPLPIAADAVHSFDSFLPGDNAMALQQLRDVGPGSAPLYLWGPQGCGKTHLLKAMALERRGLGGTLGWFAPSDITPWAFDESWSLLVLDDCEGLSAVQQQAAFALFVEATTHCVPVAAAGHMPPVDLPLRDDLRSRLGWGHVFALQVLSEPERRAVLRQEADARGIFLSDEVMAFMLNRFSRDLGSLMQLLDNLDQYALQTQRAITIPLIKLMLESE